MFSELFFMLSIIMGIYDLNRETVEPIISAPWKGVRTVTAKGIPTLDKSENWYVICDDLSSNALPRVIASACRFAEVRDGHMRQNKHYLSNNDPVSFAVLRLVAGWDIRRFKKKWII